MIRAPAPNPFRRMKQEQDAIDRARRDEAAARKAKEGKSDDRS
jgi:hypothetical protein